MYKTLHRQPSNLKHDTRDGQNVHPSRGSDKKVEIKCKGD